MTPPCCGPPKLTYRLALTGMFCAFPAISPFPLFSSSNWSSHSGVRTLKHALPACAVAVAGQGEVHYGIPNCPESMQVTEGTWSLPGGTGTWNRNSTRAAEHGQVLLMTLVAAAVVFCSAQSGPRSRPGQRKRQSHLRFEINKDDNAAPGCTSSPGPCVNPKVLCVLNLIWQVWESAV